MGHGAGIMQREILRRASARRDAFTVRQMASKLFASVDDTRLGAVRRALKGLVRMGLIEHDGTKYCRSAQPVTARREWTTPLEIVRIDPDEANVMLDGAHYLGAAGYQPTYCLTTPTRECLALFGPPVASHFKKTLTSPLELTRLWRSSECGWPLSAFLSRSIKWIKREAPAVDCIFSYADPAARNSVTGRRHVGGIYVASNFSFLGESRSTDHWIDEQGGKVSAAQCYRLFKTKSVVKIAALRPGWRHVAGEAKNLFVYPMRLSVADVLAAIGGDGSRYNDVQSAPAPWD